MDFPQLASNIKAMHEILQSNAVRAINQNITARNWLVGFWIVEFEQNGEDKAKYGERLLETIAKTIHIKGLGATTLSQCRKFYITYPNIVTEIKGLLHNLNPKIFQISEKLQLFDNEYLDKIIEDKIQIFQSVSEKLPKVESKKLFNYLSFSHFVELMSIEDPLKRLFYEIETMRGCWSVKELHRQIGSLCYERSSICKDPDDLMAYIHSNADFLSQNS